MNGPTSGDCALKGDCCHRASNIAKEKALGPDDPMLLEYRLTYNLTTNHPKTIGSTLPVQSTLAVYGLEAQDILWRIKVPRKGGMEVNGDGEATFGYGRYNCDGTFSFFSDSAAPNVSGGTRGDDPSRWAQKTVKTTVDVSKKGVDRMKIAFGDEMVRRQFINLPYVDQNTPSYPLDWELSFMGFHLTDFDTEGAGHDCVGKVDATKPNGWTAGGHFEVYTPVFGNNHSKISALGVTYCTLVSFGISAAAGLDCEKEARCTPGTLKAGGGSCMPNGKTDDTCCPWLKLPDSLCPETAADQGIFNCHPGAKGNPNKEDGYPSDTDLKCTSDKPTTPRDPDKGATDVGQCCDPLGKDTSLPACNSYRLLQEFVASAVEITDAPTKDLPKNCMAK